MSPPTPNQRMAGKVAVVTGATGGIGRATCERLVAEGAYVVVCGRRRAQGEALERTLGSSVRFVVADVEREADVQAVIAMAQTTFGRIDLLFNNAGAPAPSGEIENVDEDGFDRAVRILVRSVFFGIKHAAPIMKAQKAGSIVSNASVAAHLGGYSTSHIYSACKGAVVALSRSVAMELAPHSVRVNTVSPGAIATGIFARGAGLEPDDADKSAAVMENLLRHAQPIPRSGLPQDVAAAVVFLASDDAGFITGRDLVIDGGLTAGRRFSEMRAGAQIVHRAVTGE